DCDSRGKRDDQFSTSIFARGDNLSGSTIGTDREARHCIAQREPCVLVAMLALELRIPWTAGAHESRINRGDVHVISGEFLPHAFRPSRERELSSAVWEKVGNGNLAADRRDIHNAASLALPRRQDCLGQMKWPPEV